MTPATTTQRSQTADRILDSAEQLIQTRGYSAFSYQDIADALNIRKASIHYHFRSKAELGVSVIKRYAERFGTALGELAADRTQSSMRLLEHYCEPYVGFANSPDRVCLCGTLAGEILVLPPNMRACVKEFFELHQDWLASILQRGIDRGEFRLSATAAQTARLIFGSLQGALLVKRTTGDASQLADVIYVIKAQITVKPAAQ